MRRRLGQARAVVLAALAVLLAGTSAADGVTARVLVSLNAARARSGLPELSRRDELDATARAAAQRIAARPHRRRLEDDRAIERDLRDQGVTRFRRAAVHVDLKRGHADPVSAFLSDWASYPQAWSLAIDGGYDAIGLAIVVADDGWTILAAVFVEDAIVPSDLLALERETLRAVNRLRRERGAGELSEDPALREIARAHSADMARRGFFGHRSPDGRGPEQRVRARGLDYAKLGENLQSNRGTADPVESAVRSWSGSPGHRRTMLDAGYRRSGVGVAVDEEGRIYFTQLFLAP